MSRVRAVGIIPARWGSTRLPGKSLALIAGKPLVVRVLERARRARELDEVIVATDDTRIVGVVEAAGGRAVMTRPEHPSGTDRVAEAVRGLEVGLVVNIQGDEPLLDPALVDRLVTVMRDDPSWDMGTAAAPLDDPAEAARSSVVKVVWGEEHRALYFSRAPIPCVRDADVPPPGTYWRHIGLYAYRRAFLERLVAAPPHRLEQLEKLEQLRALALGARLVVLETAEAAVGVDTPEDVAAVEALLGAGGTNT
jgi:3-deoxy-manno-octulosonate cytidylyltransferase (CMP-KDO synthetase)